MRETDPDGLNMAHRAGSVPPILALKEEKRTVIQEILLAMVLLLPSKLEYVALPIY